MQTNTQNPSIPSGSPERPPWRMVFPQTIWERALQGLLEQDNAWAWGPLRVHASGPWREALIEGLQIGRTAPSGIDRVPGDGWYCLRFADSLTDGAVDAIISACRPRPSQILVVLVVNPQPPNRWFAVLCAQGITVAVAEVRVTGSQPLRLPETHVNQQTTADTRWSRTRGVLGETTRNWLSQATVTQVGTGRLGILLAWHWASLGVRRIRLCDADVLEDYNLNDMPGLRERQVGSPKIQALSAALKAFRPGCELTLCQQTCERANANGFFDERSDLLITAVDDDLPRYVISQAARRTLTPHLDVASQITRNTTETSLTYLGDVRLLLPGMGCVCCVGQLDVTAVRRRLTAPLRAIPLTQPRDWWEQRAGSLLSWNMQIAGAAVDVWLDLVAGLQRQSYWLRMSRQAGNHLTTNGGPMGRGESCPLCLGREI